MLLETPKSYSPSSLSQFTSCPLAFRYSYIERRERKPQYAATKGSIIHRALELLFENDPEQRDHVQAKRSLEMAFKEYESISDLVDLNLSENELKELINSSSLLIDKYFQIENPKRTNTIGLELKLETEIDGITLRGIIDRLDIDDNGDLIVIDYKTGSVPYKQMENSKMDSMHIYSLLCLENFGKLPAQIQLIYLSKPVIILGTPSEHSIKSIANKSKAIATAVKIAVDNVDFRPKVSRLCDWCSFQELCPAKGGMIPK